MVYILIWKPISPVDIIDISAMVTRQGTCTPPHWVTIWSRDACSQGSKFMYWLSHGTNIYSSLVPRSCPGFCHLQNDSFTWHIGRARLYVRYISKISESTLYYPHFEFVVIPKTSPKTTPRFDLAPWLRDESGSGLGMRPPDNLNYQTGPWNQDTIDCQTRKRWRHSYKDPSKISWD